jgi:hypothetical protein
MQNENTVLFAFMEHKNDPLPTTMPLRKVNHAFGENEGMR